jgi:hypothetical protein
MSPYEIWMRSRGKQLPRHWRKKLRAQRKHQRQARLAQRGKR